MTGEPGVDHPEEQSEAEVTLTGRGISVSTRVEFVGDGVISVRPSVGEYVEQVVASAGDRVEVFWKAGEETRALPAEVLTADAGAAPRWRLQITGPSEISQRRQAVRGRVSLPLEIGYGSAEMTGETVDLSENGMRATVDGRLRARASVALKFRWRTVISTKRPANRKKMNMVTESK